MALREDDYSVFSGSEIFRDLDHVQIGKILGIARVVKFRAGEVILREGDIGDTMYIMKEGTVEVIKNLVLVEIEDSEDRKKTKVFTKLEAKDHAVFGELALLDAMKRTATVRAVTDCVLYEINRADFLKLAEEDCKLGYRVILNLAKIIGARLRKADEETVKLTTILSIVLSEV
ncbi:MAG: cyclic nucleotide-binding domain-containing protein [Syntrophales bacterium]|nr:cyclic nucleotide-binding domain-containing protein [Syntrophales bacterium]